MDKLGTSFHRTFALSRPGLAQVLRVAGDVEQHSGGSEILTFSRLEADTTLGPVYIASMRRYAYGTGLLDGEEKSTSFGKMVMARDPDLTMCETMWLMHFWMTVECGGGPVYWHDLITKCFRPGDTVERNELTDSIHRSVNDRGAESISRKTAGPAATAFLGTYSKPDALGPLGFLREESSARYVVEVPSPPALWCFAYALAEYWEANWGEVTGVNLTRVAEEGGIGPIFMMGGGLINRYLGDLQREGFAVVQRRTPPFQLTRNWESPQVFLELIYG
jgi:hypothetical protein